VAKPQYTLTPEESARFWSKVDRSGGSAACWPWLAAKTDKGYGVFGLRGRTYKAHRIAFAERYGSIPDDLCVLHDCPTGDNPACCNWDHHFLGTRPENNADMAAKGRHVPGGTYSRGGYIRGTAHHAAKLTEADVREIRRLAGEGLSCSAIGRRFGINQSAAYKVAKGLHWGHVR
jgi:hypothetical protein